MFELLGRMVRLPITVFVFTARQMVEVLEGWGTAAELVPPRTPATRFRPSPETAAVGSGTENSSAAPSAQPSTHSKEESTMPDKNLNDDMVKLVEYSILSVQRGHEGEKERGQKIVTDRLTEDAFVTWVIADYLEGDNGNGHEIPSGQRKYLRVYYNVLQRWPREELHYEQEQLAVLRDINESIKESKSSSGSSKSSGSKSKT